MRVAQRVVSTGIGGRALQQRSNCATAAILSTGGEIAKVAPRHSQNDAAGGRRWTGGGAGAATASAHRCADACGGIDLAETETGGTSKVGATYTRCPDRANGSGRGR